MWYFQLKNSIYWRPLLLSFKQNMIKWRFLYVFISFFNFIFYNKIPRLLGFSGENKGKACTIGDSYCVWQLLLHIPFTFSFNEPRSLDNYCWKCNARHPWHFANKFFTFPTSVLLLSESGESNISNSTGLSSMAFKKEKKQQLVFHSKTWECAANSLTAVRLAYSFWTSL